MKRYLLASLLSFSCMTASAAVVDFNGYANTIFGDEDTGNGIAAVSVQGYTFSNAADHFHLIDMAVYDAASNGTSSLLSDRAGALTMTKDDGGEFDLTSLLGYGYFSSTLSITGNFAGGGSITADFAVNPETFSLLELAGFSGLSSVTFSGSPDTPSAPAGFGIENVAVQDAGTAVPEPFTLALAGLALAGLALSRRRG